MIITTLSFLLPIQKTRTFIQLQKLPLVEFTLYTAPKTPFSRVHSICTQDQKTYSPITFLRKWWVHLFDKSSYRHNVLF